MTHMSPTRPSWKRRACSPSHYLVLILFCTRNVSCFPRTLPFRTSASMNLPTPAGSCVHVQLRPQEEQEAPPATLSLVIEQQHPPELPPPPPILLAAAAVQADTMPTNRRLATTTTNIWNDTILPMAGMIFACLAMALALLAWEDLTCTYVLPSRHRTSLDRPTTATRSSWQLFAQSTIHGLGFGYDQRQLLDVFDPATQDLPSYNEVMLQHRLERVPRWRLDAATTAAADSHLAASDAIHTLVECLQTIQQLQVLAVSYDWDAIRTALHSEPLATEFEASASYLRATAMHTKDKGDDTIGFDWGSCAWRHCGALADAQEALDELEHLLGLLEPPEALFCLDVMERSVRDILTSVDWKLANDKDLQTWRDMAEYKPYQSKNAAIGESGLDDEYLKALQELRID